MRGREAADTESTPLPRQERKGGGIAAGYPPASPDNSASGSPDSGLRTFSALRGDPPCAASLERFLTQQNDYT